MKKTVLFIILTALLFPLVAQEKPEAEKEKAAIIETALNYIEGWYEGDAKRMAKALHPELHKVGIMSMKGSDKLFLTPNSFSKMIALTRAGIGKSTPKDKRNISVTVFDIYRTTASAKSMSADFIDYLLLAKLDGEWKIINVLWEYNKK
ncbi:MAG: nuclear transport factor 2 family protein [bacterium]|nr:nuclear transport factor 2 family protein [bacterium]